LTMGGQQADGRLNGGVYGIVQRGDYLFLATAGSHYIFRGVVSYTTQPALIDYVRVMKEI
jgi:hypothetical protein